MVSSFTPRHHSSPRDVMGINPALPVLFIVLDLPHHLTMELSCLSCAYATVKQSQLLLVCLPLLKKRYCSDRNILQ